MKNNNFKESMLAVASIAAISIGFCTTASAASYDATVDYKKNGGYEASAETEATTAAGAAVTNKEKSDVDVEDDGRLSREDSSSTKVDPKGVYNGATHDHKTSYKEKRDGGYEASGTDEVTRDRGTNTKVDTDVDVSVDEHGNVVRKVTTTKDVDPSGVLNSTSTKTQKKYVNGKLIRTEKE